MASSGDRPASEPELEDYGTLKYQLLGPSLTKAGQDSVDQQKVG
jgi:DNA polymerase kappa